MGGNDEQHSADSGRNNLQGTDIQLTISDTKAASEDAAFFVSDENSEEIDIEPSIEAEGGYTGNVQLSFFEENDTAPTNRRTVVTKNSPEIEAVITADIMRGSGFVDGKFRIYEFYRDNNPSNREFANMLQKEYGLGGHSGSGLLDLSSHNSKGITLRFKQDGKEFSKMLPWNNVASRISELIRANQYITEHDIEDRISSAKYYIENDNSFYREHSVNILKQYGADTPNAEFTADKFDVANADIYMIHNGKYLAQTAINANEEMWQRLELNGLKRLENSENCIVFETDGNKWSVFYIPDKWGNKTNNIPASVLLRPDERDTLAEITAKIEHKALGIDETVSEESINAVNAEDNAIETAHKKTHTKTDFTITDENLGTGGAKAKFKANIEAIKLLNELGSQNRLATAEEQEILSRYVGWGGLQQAFDSNNSAWSDEYNQLIKSLEPADYENARASTLSAYYTSPIVINAIYDGLERLGFDGGNILEPALGVGNFFGMMPENMRNSSKLYGVEIDNISGNIAKQLYQNADIQVMGFEKTAFPDNFFDVAVGNVPFGQFKLSEKRYNKLNLNIHDHFFAKSIDKVRAGGVIAFITSKGTLDKANPQFRKYLAQRAELLGAIRLPNNAFKSNAGTEVTSDIIFLQKRDRIIDIEPEWVNIGKTAEGIPVNKYFELHPEMILGEMKQGVEYSLYGNPDETACVAIERASLKEQLKSAISHLQGEITKSEKLENVEEIAEKIPAQADVCNYSYTVVNDDIYYRENSVMIRKEFSATVSERIKGMIEIRDCVRTLIDYQVNEYGDNEISRLQEQLNRIYDSFTEKYGLINSRNNAKAFGEDSSYHLLTSLENLDENGELASKADMFYKRTIKPIVEITHVDTASEALAISLSEKARVDMQYMQQLTGKSEEAIFAELKSVIYLNPMGDDTNGADKYLTADEYLSGNIREKLHIAQEYAKTSSLYEQNVNALTAVMPKPLEASDIDIRLGATWIGTDVVKDFIIETIKPSSYARTYQLGVKYSEYTSEWHIDGKNSDNYNVIANTTYGTSRKNAYEIIEDTLNLRDTKVYDRVTVEGGKTISVINKKETELAQAKQDLIKQTFKEWVYNDFNRRDSLVSKYNILFNSTRPREYDGSHLNFVGINPEIKLREHQLNAIARIIYGGNTLLAHEVGAGKTFEMVAAAMESKRLGLCTKSLFVVPNHLTEQMGSEFLTLYPSANILVATKDDFSTKNRRRLCAKISTGDYDAVIIGHSQLEKIPVSRERQERMIRRQISEIADGISELGRKNGNTFSVKQLEKTKRNLEARLTKLLESPQRDDVVTFEELGIDRLFVDEAHSFKNLFIYTKMHNVAGVQQTEAQKSSDLYLKCQYMDELTGGKGVIFATGTPVSNSMTELYTMQRYLQSARLKEMHWQNFDAWASMFGETVTSSELAPEGTGYRQKTRFAKFSNLPELMNVFRETADIKTSDMLNLPVPEAKYHNIVVKPTENQKQMVKALSERAKRIHDKLVAPEEDNMLKVTNDGRKIGLDQRMINPLLPDESGTKVNMCVDNVFNIWQNSAENKSTQLIFCDFSTPKSDGAFNVYDDIRSKLIAKGVPKAEIEYIHNADSEAKKKDLFSKVRSGQVRILMGSTAKMGAGTNVQTKLIALHDVDCPWRPSDLEQRHGRIIRQGNENDVVEIYRYVTEATFDAYLYQTIENKQRFISQIMSSKSPVRSCEDVDEATLSYAEVKALCAGNPLIKEKMELEISVAKLKTLEANHRNEMYNLENQVMKHLPERIRSAEIKIEGLRSDIEHIRTFADNDDFEMVVNGKTFTDKAECGEELIACCSMCKGGTKLSVGTYKGFDMYVSYDIFANEHYLDLHRERTYQITLGSDAQGNIRRINNALGMIGKHYTDAIASLDSLHIQLQEAKEQLNQPFAQSEELAEKSARLKELSELLEIEEEISEDNDNVISNTDVAENFDMKLQDPIAIQYNSENTIERTEQSMSQKYFTGDILQIKNENSITNQYVVIEAGKDSLSCFAVSSGDFDAKTHVSISCNEKNKLEAPLCVKTDKLIKISADGDYKLSSARLSAVDVQSFIEKHNALNTKAKAIDIKQSAIKSDIVDRSVVDIGESFKLDPSTIAEYMAYRAKFTKYSAQNQLRIYAQNPHATFVKTYKQWADMGHKVIKKGAIQLLQPAFCEYFKDENGNVKKVSQASSLEKAAIANGEIETWVKKRFEAFNVFDISQTNCPPSEYPKFFEKGFESKQHNDIYKVLRQIAENNGITVSVEDVNSISLHGYYSPKEDKIVLSDKLNDTELAHTMSHELAHALMHKTTTQSVSVCEFEADCLSAQLASKFGLDNLSETNKHHLAQSYRKIPQDHNLSESFERVHKAYSFVEKQFDDTAEEMGISFELQKQQQTQQNVQDNAQNIDSIPEAANFLMV
ncbi:MAG: DEAD/DEAH box helicase family protein [Oscillospiraceae bacterium]|nr:DEAD/DEAH box helicase family protein [Oscillospiraceae bacterium]